MLSEQPVFADLRENAGLLKAQSLHELFVHDDKRIKKFSANHLGMHLDFSKQLINDETWRLLQEVANSVQLKNKIDALFAGEEVNPTEGRPALHTALRSPANDVIEFDGININPAIQHQLDLMGDICHKLQNKQWRGYTGKAITDVVNIGVGGSDLGPMLVCDALDEFTHKDSEHLNFHFVSSMDGSQIFNLLDSLNPETTLFIICSKSFTTVDTFYNANTALAWLTEHSGNRDQVMTQHIIGVSAKPEKMTDWGIPKSNQLKIWDWVGGRFSLWSTIGLSIAIKVGMNGFKQLLSGANSMDEHFQSTSFEQNIPVIMGLLGVWNSTFLNIQGHSVLPYDGRLQLLPNYLTQLEMESNGKSASISGQTLDYKTCPILWGEIGSNAQHAYYQLLHQGTQQVSCDFIAPAKRYHKKSNNNSNTNTALIQQHELSLANCLAQSRVLAFGNKAIDSHDAEEVNPHKSYRGNQPSSTLLLDELTPFTLGALIALYEHKVYVMAAIWDINPFDQWGVELGKKISLQTLDSLQSDTPLDYDDSTNELIRHIRAIKQENES